MTALSRKQIQDIEGKIYLISRLPREKWSAAFSEITSDLKQMIASFEKDRRRDSARVRRCLKVLLAILDSGHIVIQGTEDLEVFRWIKKEARSILTEGDS